MRKKSNHNNHNRVTYGERIAKLEANTGHILATIKDLKENHLKAMDIKLDGVTKMLNTRLPIWATILFSLLTSGCVGLLVLYLSAIAKH